MPYLAGKMAHGPTNSSGYYNAFVITRWRCDMTAWQQAALKNVASLAAGLPRRADTAVHRLKFYRSLDMWTSARRAATRRVENGKCNKRAFDVLFLGAITVNLV